MLKAVVAAIACVALSGCVSEQERYSKALTEARTLCAQAGYTGDDVADRACAVQIAQEIYSADQNRRMNAAAILLQGSQNAQAGMQRSYQPTNVRCYKFGTGVNCTAF